MTNTAAITNTKTPHWREYLELCKPKVVLLLLVTAVVGMQLASPNWVPISTVIIATIGILAPLFSPGAAALAGLLDSSALALWLFPALLGAGLTVGLLSEQAHNSAKQIAKEPTAERI